MTNPSFDLHMTYLGWSGFRLSWSGGPQVVVDPPDVAGLNRERETCLLLSHGHSEHVAGALKYLADTTRVAPVTIVASQTVCRYLQCRYSRRDDRFIPCRPGDVKILPDLRIDVFGWQHMPLLPSGLRPALRYLFHLVLHPNFAIKIIRDDLKVMRVGPTLGFRLVPKRGPRLLLYSEGLHMHTSKIEVKETGRLLGAEVLLFAVRAEDAHVIPELVAEIGSSVAVHYEAHRFWREGFGLPIADLGHIAIQLKNRGISALTVTKGKTIIISNTHTPLTKGNYT
jgi:hypothetical protein